MDQEALNSLKGSTDEVLRYLQRAIFAFQDLTWQMRGKERPPEELLSEIASSGEGMQMLLEYATSAHSLLKPQYPTLADSLKDFAEGLATALPGLVACMEQRDLNQTADLLEAQIIPRLTELRETASQVQSSLTLH